MNESSGHPTLRVLVIESGDFVSRAVSSGGGHVMDVARLEAPRDGVLGRRRSGR